MSDARSRRHLRQTAIGYGFLTPSLLGVVVFMLIPVGVVLWLTTQEWDLISAPEFVGTTQIIDVLGDPAFLNALGVTLLFIVLTVPVQIGIGMLLASLLTKGVPGTTVFRTLIVIPWISAPLALGVVWKWIFAPTGGLLSALAGQRLEILVSPVWALPAVAFVVIWNSVGYTSLFFVAGILAIPTEILEAAEVDGASSIRAFWSIILPLLRPTLFFVTVTSVIAAFNVFDQIYALTGGGPQGHTSVLAWQIYAEAFENWNLGRAAVMATAMMLILVAITLIQHWYFRRRITYDLS